MTNFIIRFLISNIFISMIIGILFAAKKIFQKSLSGRMQYHLWFVLLGLLAVPFIPIKSTGFLQIFSWLSSKCSTVSDAGAAIEEAAVHTSSGTAAWMNDFALSVSKKTPSAAGFLLWTIWIVGICAMILLIAKSQKQLSILKKSALPLQNTEVRKLYISCLKEMHIAKELPIYSTAFLKSPIIVGLFNPRIYLPIYLVSDYTSADIRYILLHELQHYKHKDALANYLMNMAGILYWFNPFVWCALREMRSEREVACDTSVLELLTEDAYEDYGNTLINFAEKISRTPFPFAAGISSSMRQMKRRILNIASYEKPSVGKQLKGVTVFLLIAGLLMGTAPVLSTYANHGNHYLWSPSSEHVSYTDLSAYFGKYEGSFVLYNLEGNSWKIHNSERAALRTAPNSTYKIYDALFGLEQDVITPENSFIPWDNRHYPFDTWNKDQTLSSAMASSVNWYFQSIDRKLGEPTIHTYLHQIGYGNETMNGDLSSYWIESGLKISPIEQVELLTRLYHNDFHFAPENIQAVKNALRLSTSGTRTLYGKTGTGCVNGQDVNGWFVGYIESPGHTSFFAVNISADTNATGIAASQIALSVLTDMNIWK